MSSGGIIIDPSSLYVTQIQYNEGSYLDQHLATIPPHGGHRGICTYPSTQWAEILSLTSYNSESTHTHTPEKHVKVTFKTYFGRKKIHKQTM